MKREDKIAKRKARAARRKFRRDESYRNRIRVVSELGRGQSLSLAERTYGGGWQVTSSWPDPDSPTGYSQKCSYDAWGTCQSPCNGDC
jgi:hypothetical protein